MLIYEHIKKKIWLFIVFLKYIRYLRGEILLKNHYVGNKLEYDMYHKSVF